MKKNNIMISGMLLLSVTLSGCAFYDSTVVTDTPANQENPATDKNITTSNKAIFSTSSLGEILTDSNGMTLYYFTKDSNNKSTCKGGCLTKWPVFYSEDTKGEDFSVITREDGKKQNTYKGKPLYYFFKDTKKGNVNGEGVKNVWYVIKKK